MKCKYCDAKATMGLIWADGRAIVPVCGDEHLAKARRDVGEQGRVRKLPEEVDIDVSGWGLRARGRTRSALDELRTPAGKHIAGTKPDRMPKEFLKALGTDWSVFRARRVGENRLSVRIDGKKFTIYSRES